MLEKTIIKLCRKINGSYFILKTIKIKSVTENLVKFKNHTYNLNQKKPSFLIGVNKYYYIDIDKNCQLFFEETEGLNPESLDLIVSRRLIQTLTTSLKESTFSVEIKNLVLGGLIGACIGVIVMFFLAHFGVI